MSLMLFKNTKIISTIGPAITQELDDFSDFEVHGKPMLNQVLTILDKIFYSGVNCMRLNFSHSDNDKRLYKLHLINEAQKLIIDNAFKKLNQKKNVNIKFIRPIAIMCDTKGPEIRVYNIENPKGELYIRGNKVNLHCREKILGNQDKFSIIDASGNYDMSKDCVVGNCILLDDGKLSLKILSVDKASGIVKTLIENTHLLKTNKRINLPGANYSMPFLSDVDVDHIKFALDNDFQYIALSFVNKSENISEIKKVLKEYRNNKSAPIPQIYSKIETLYSLKNIDEIIKISDGIMIARGDLGLEIPFYEVPYWTKLIIKKCAIKGIPVIVATQMLDSLEKSIIPTRAEVTDVYRAAELASDCTMLSGETAQGLFPVMAVETMSKILIESENKTNYSKLYNYFLNNNYSSNIFSWIKNLRNFISDNNVSFVVVNENEITDELIYAYSNSKSSIPLVILFQFNSFDESKACFRFNKFALNRSIYTVGYMNPENITLSIQELFKNFLISYGVDINEKSIISFWDCDSWKKHIYIN